MMVFVTGCNVAASKPAVCTGTEVDRTSHAGALVEDGGIKSRRTGAVLIAKIDAGCGD